MAPLYAIPLVEEVDLLAGLLDFCFFSCSSLSRRLAPSVCSIVCDMIEMLL